MYNILMVAILLTSMVISADVKCEQFKTYEDAKKYFKSKKAGFEALDRNHNGSPCEHLQKISTKSKNKKRTRIIIYKYGSPDGFGQSFTSINSCEKEVLKLTKSHIGSDYSYKCESL